MVIKYFLSFCELPVHSVDNALYARFLILLKSNFSFSFAAYALVLCCRNYCQLQC